METRGARAVRELLDSNGFSFSKALGQNFLIDANISEKIVKASGIDKSCGVLEVGPGAGALTGYLAKAAAKVIAVELDKRLADILEQTMPDTAGVEVVRGDILKLDIAGLVGGKMHGLRTCVCANLPYSITTPALTALINASVFEEITVMVQREVARRICAHPGVREYGALSVFIQYHTFPVILFDVPPECFMPRPKVYSAVVTMKTRPESLLSSEVETLFFKIVRAAFNQRRKTLANALFAVFGSEMSKDSLIDIIKECGFDVNVRGEALDIEDFIKLTARIGANRGEQQIAAYTADREQ